MKKILTLLSSFAVTAGGVSTVVACSDKDETDLGKLTDVSVTSKKELADFKTELFKALKNVKGFGKIDDKTVKIFKEDGSTELTIDDVKTGGVKVNVKAEGTTFTGNKVVTVTWTEKPAS